MQLFIQRNILQAELSAEMNGILEGDLSESRFKRETPFLTHPVFHL